MGVDAFISGNNDDTRLTKTSVKSPTNAMKMEGKRVSFDYIHLKRISHDCNKNFCCFIFIRKFYIMRGVTD